MNNTEIQFSIQIDHICTIHFLDRRRIFSNLKLLIAFQARPNWELKIVVKRDLPILHHLYHIRPHVHVLLVLNVALYLSQHILHYSTLLFLCPCFPA